MNIHAESRAKLEKTMKKLLNLEVTREELLENQHSDCEVDSTTGSAAGSSGRKKKAVGKSDKGIRRCKKDATISAAKERARQLFKTASSNSTNCSQSPSAVENQSPTIKESNQVAELQKELEQLKAELLHQKKTAAGLSTVAMLTQNDTFSARHHSDQYVL